MVVEAINARKIILYSSTIHHITFTHLKYENAHLFPKLYFILHISSNLWECTFYPFKLYQFYTYNPQNYDNAHLFS